MTYSIFMNREITTARQRCSEQERRYAEEYVVDHNVHAAAFRAGIHTGTGYKWRCENENVMGYISVLESVKSEVTGMTAERVMFEYALIGFANITDYVMPDPDDETQVVLDLSALSREQGAAIKTIKTEVTKLGVTKTTLELHDKTAALKALGTSIGMVSERTENKNLNVTRELPPITPEEAKVINGQFETEC